MQCKWGKQGSPHWEDPLWRWEGENLEARKGRGTEAGQTMRHSRNNKGAGKEEIMGLLEPSRCKDFAVYPEWDAVCFQIHELDLTQGTRQSPYEVRWKPLEGVYMGKSRKQEGEFLANGMSGVRKCSEPWDRRPEGQEWESHPRNNTRPGDNGELWPAKYKKVK